jgi:hypothetical protein
MFTPNSSLNPLPLAVVVEIIGIGGMIIAEASSVRL